MKRSERGFTLIELLVVTAIVALIGVAAAMASFQVINVTKRSNDHTTVIRQVQNAGYWISRDTQMAQAVVIGDDPETPELEFITFKWSNWENGDVHKIAHNFEDMPSGLKKLKRQHLIYDADGVEIGSEATLVAQYIDSATFAEQDGAWKLTIQASSGTETETREYEVNPRVNNKG